MNWVFYATAKVLIFQQITTSAFPAIEGQKVFYATAKVLIFQQITTHDGTNTDALPGVLCYCKGTNFSANHNTLILYPLWQRGVLCYCKGTNFSANHNTMKQNVFSVDGVLCYCKGTNFSANHNSMMVGLIGKLVFYATAKVLIFQQITT